MCTLGRIHDDKLIIAALVISYLLEVSLQRRNRFGLIPFIDAARATRGGIQRTYRETRVASE